MPISKAILMAFVASQVQAGVACMLCPCIWDAYPMLFLMKFIIGYHHTLSVSLATFYTPTLRVPISCGQRKRESNVTVILASHMTISKFIVKNGNAK